VIQHEISRVLVLNLFWHTLRCSDTALHTCVLDNAFALIEGQPPKLIADPELAASLLSTACMRVFEGEKAMRSTARILDYFAYGEQIRAKAAAIAVALTGEIGDRQPGEVGEEVVIQD